ncbi:MAG TPA: hypothetical protein VJ867_01670 [Gemmatimonadaceae bacterium]|nr:hypothetical protein [Gemmatimonadaceae bacterium]
MSETVRVFVNAAAVDVARGSSAIDCVRAWRVDEADAVTQGRRLITDSRGLPIAPDTAASAGSIYRTIAKRDPSPADDS